MHSVQARWGTILNSERINAFPTECVAFPTELVAFPTESVAFRTDSKDRKIKKILTRQLSIILFFLLFSCSSYKIVDQSGDIALKKQQILRKNYYIGFAGSTVDYETAFNSALNNAYRLISNELGFNIQVSTTDFSLNFDSNLRNDFTYITRQTINIDSEHSIQTRINRIYQERVVDKSNIYNNVWVEIYFDIDAFYRQYYNYWTDLISNISSNSFLTNTEILLSSKNRFDEEKRYLPHVIISEYEKNYNFFVTQYDSFIRGVNVTNINNNHRFSNNFIFKFTDSKGSLLANLPVTINNIRYVTNLQGLINYIADYDKEIVIIAGHNLSNFYPARLLEIYRNDSFSPFFTKNVTINVISRESVLSESFGSVLRRKGYNIDINSDIILELNHQVTIQRISLNQYLANLSINVQVKNSRGVIISSINFPSDRTETIRGYADTEAGAIRNAFSLQWYSIIEDDIKILQNMIVDVLLEGG